MSAYEEEAFLELNESIDSYDMEMNLELNAQVEMSPEQYREMINSGRLQCRERAERSPGQSHERSPVQSLERAERSPGQSRERSPGQSRERAERRHFLSHLRTSAVLLKALTGGLQRKTVLPERALPLKLPQRRHFKESYKCHL